MSGLFVLYGCSTSEDDGYKNTETDTTTVNVKSTSSYQLTIWELESQLTDVFINNYGAHLDTLSYSSIIQKLQIVTENNTDFINLKPAGNYQIITASGLTQLVNNYEILYANLPVSSREKLYINQIARVQNYTTFNNLLNNIETDTSLNVDNKQFLTYMAHAIFENGDKDDDNPPPIDSAWRKQKICAITEGWNNNKAESLFNAVLINLLY